MIWMYLKNDVISFNRKTIYGRQGERVVVVSNRHPAMIVRSETGNSFSCSVDDLSPTKIQTNDTRNIKHKK